MTYLKSMWDRTAILLLLLIPSPLLSQRSDGLQPNLIVILADDLGYADVGFHGSDIKTPHLDQLAKSGVRLNRCYTLPFCTPTRAALLTGRYPFRYGLQTAAIPADAQYGLNLTETLLPQILKANGYATAIVGKWHLGHGDEKYWPNNRGFDYQYGPLVGEIDYYTHSANGKRDWYENGVALLEEGYTTELLGAQAVATIKRHTTSQPLFLYLTFTAPHAPYQAPESAQELYLNVDDPTRRSYAAMVSVLDQQVGAVVDALKERGMFENSLIVFMSDNGGNRNSAMSGESDVSELVLPASNAPYSGGKGTILEGGCRVVGIVSYPTQLKPQTYEPPIHVVDWLPTLLEAANIEHNFGDRKTDGLTFWGALSGTNPASVREEVIYNIEPFRAAISDEQWKLIVRPALPPQVELYDLINDPREEHDLANAHPEIVGRLKKRVFELAESAETPLFLEYMARNSDKSRDFISSIIENGASLSPSP